ncbi:MAG TPA: threonine ammonia-lyase, partial [Gemmatimonadales bacterium]|nr:threonine ammonia-lyase [Gemmatimonadales bacterium]
RPLRRGIPVQYPTIDDINAARSRLDDVIVRTPLVPALALREVLPCNVHLKLENAQRTGSFKDRGALNRLLGLDVGQRARGVVTASAGNHAQALAYHGSRLGIAVDVVMPVHTPITKIANTQRFGANIRLTGATLSDSMTEAHRIEHEEGRILVHPFDDDRVIGGQGTVGLELLEQLPDLTAVVVPIGGGGLISGIAIAIKAARPEVRIFGVEAAAAASALASRRAGKVIHIETSETIADGIAVKQVGERTFPLIEQHVEDIIDVSEEEIAHAVHLLLERQKTVAEGAGAAALAGVMTGRLPLGENDNAVVLVSGGNIDLSMLQRIVDRGLVSDGRLARIAVTVRDRPGNLARLTRIVGEEGANVLEVRHRRAFADISVRDVTIVMHLQARGPDQIASVTERLRREGFEVETS